MRPRSLSSIKNKSLLWKCFKESKRSLLQFSCTIICFHTVAFWTLQVPDSNWWHASQVKMAAETFGAINWVGKPFIKTTSFCTYQSSVGVFDGNHVGMVHSCDAILVGFRGRVQFINNPIVCINVVRLYFVISLLLITTVVGIKGSLRVLVVEESMGVNRERSASHILEMDFYCIPYFAFYYWTQKAKVRWMGFFLFKGPIGVFSIEHLLVLGRYSSCTA